MDPALHVLPALKYVCSVPEITFFDLVTLTFKVDLRVIHVDALTKFNDPRCNTLRDMESDLNYLKSEVLTIRK